jgi:hypothetical protein
MDGTRNHGLGRFHRLITANCQLAGAPLTLSTTGTRVDDTDPANPVNFGPPPNRRRSGRHLAVGQRDPAVVQ